MTVSNNLEQARKLECGNCGGTFDEGEWESSPNCPECEQPKHRSPTTRKDTGA